MDRRCHNLLVHFAVAAALLLASAAAQAQGQKPVTIIHAGHLFAVPGQPVLEEQTVVVYGDRIGDILNGYRTPQALNEPDARIVDLRGGYVLPGLIDSHVHLTVQLGPDYKMQRVTQSDAYKALQAAVYARKTLMAGFTTVRDLQSTGNAVFALRDAIAAGLTPGPRVLVAGNMISVTGGHGDVHGFREEILDLFQPSGVCDGADDCRRAVRDQVKRGADVIKFAATGGVLSEVAAGYARQMTAEEMRAIVETAHSLGRKATAHAHGVDGIRAALEAGVDSIEHGTFADAQDAAAFRRADAYLIPTLLAPAFVMEMAQSSDALPPAIREKALEVGASHAERFARLAQRDVKIAFGTDSGVSPHGRNAEEFKLMVDNGMAPAQAIRAATVAAAEAIGLADEIGTIEAGKAADIVAVGADPLADITVLEDISFVMKGGRIYKE